MKTIKKKSVPRRRRRQPIVGGSHPDFPPSMPASCSVQDREGYRNMVAHMRKMTDHSEVVSCAATIAKIATEAKRVGKFADRLWAILRAWNDARRHVWAPNQKFCCDVCGEWRLDRFEGEGTVVRHAVLVSVDLSVNPPTANIAPVGCQHAGFSLVCKTCDSVAEGFVPYVDDGDSPEMVGAPTTPKKDFSIN